MTYEQIAEMMEEMGLPFAYHHFAEGESPAQCQQLKRYWYLPCIKNQIEYLGQNTLR